MAGGVEEALVYRMGRGTKRSGDVTLPSDHRSGTCWSAGWLVRGVAELMCEAMHWVLKGAVLTSAGSRHEEQCTCS